MLVRQWLFCFREVTVVSKYAGCFAVADAVMAAFEKEVQKIPREDMGRAIMLVNGRMTKFYADFQVESAMAQQRAERSNRTALGLQKAKSKGVKLGASGAQNIQKAVARRVIAADEFAENLREDVLQMLGIGATHSDIAVSFNERGILTSKGTGRWSATQVGRLAYRIHALRRLNRDKMPDAIIRLPTDLIEPAAESAPEKPDAPTMIDGAAAIDAFFN